MSKLPPASDLASKLEYNYVVHYYSKFVDDESSSNELGDANDSHHSTHECAASKLNNIRSSTEYGIDGFENGEKSSEDYYEYNHKSHESCLDSHRKKQYPQQHHHGIKYAL